MIRDPKTGTVGAEVDLGSLKPGDQVCVVMDGWQPTLTWDITIISVDPVLLFKPRERWITGICQNMRCRVLVRAKAEDREND
jgi:hypothetical protein